MIEKLRIKITILHSMKITLLLLLSLDERTIRFLTTSSTPTTDAFHSIRKIVFILLLKPTLQELRPLNTILLYYITKILFHRNFITPTTYIHVSLSRQGFLCAFSWTKIIPPSNSFSQFTSYSGKGKSGCSPSRNSRFPFTSTFGAQPRHPRSNLAISFISSSSNSHP